MKKGGLHPLVSKIDSLELGIVWKFVTDKNFNGKHNSLEDVKAQSDIFLHHEFVQFINTSFLVQKIEDIFSSSQQREWRKDMESVRPVHKLWMEISHQADIAWEHRRLDQYTGSLGGSEPGPTPWIKEVVGRADSLCEVSA